MFVQLFFLALFHTILAKEKKYYNVDSLENVKTLFENFLHEYNKTYVGFEKYERLHIFHTTLKEINRLNLEHPLTIFGITYFTDLTAEEMNAYKGLLPLTEVEDVNGLCTVLGDPATHTAPEALDWRDQAIVTPPKNQQDCGSCWAFSATATIESQYARKTGGQQLDLSEQQLVDCDDVSQGCAGGLPTWAFTKLIQENGQEGESDYPYQAKESACQFDSGKVCVRVASCNTFSLSSEDALKEVVATMGPLSIGVDAASFNAYNGGIDTTCANNRVNHAVQLVGYGSEGGVDFWLIKNSYGPTWGENGFIRIKRGVNCMGLLNSQISSATLA